MTLDLMRLPASPPFDPAAIPDEVTLVRDARQLSLTWANGTKGAVSAERLRLRCRCAWCTRDRLEGRFPTSAGDVAITKIEPKGSYAIHIAFSDDHARGIFPWVYLRELAEPDLGTGATELPVSQAAEFPFRECDR